MRGVILDVDGTLVDSNGAHARAWVDALAEQGRPVAYARVRPLMGMGGDKVLPVLTDFAEDSRAGKAVATRRSEIFRIRYLPSVKVFPRVRDLVERMRREGLRVVVGSSASEDDLRALLDKVRVDDLLDDQTSADDAENSKPDPDVVVAALHRLRLPGADVLMLGDTPYDVEAATRAGVRTIALRCGGGWSDADLAGAIAIYDDPAHLLAEYDTSPLVMP